MFFKKCGLISIKVRKENFDSPRNIQAISSTKLTKGEIAEFVFICGKPKG
jgi:hypothetical protein